MAAQLKAILVDVGGTLLPNGFEVTPSERAERAEALSAVLGAPLEQAVAIFDRVNADLLSSPTCTADAVVAGALAAYGCARTGDALKRARQALCVPLSHVVQPFDGAGFLLQGIRELGLACVVVSNTDLRDAEMYRRDFADFGWSGWVNTYVTSVDVGARKPDVRMFQTALGAAGAEPHQAVMVGNSELADIAPAVQLGMGAILVAVEEPPPVTTAAAACCVSLNGALELLCRWAGPVPPSP
ncbi:MAG TPA: HAD family hydrolase [Acidimicrobiales bacterium]|nr:HAD family hydrolase [Acidimicrobiales bacterium]